MTKETQVINIGSINIDHIYRVPHLVAAGETLGSHSLTTVLGGKGANQSIALSRAGCAVAHVGKLSLQDDWVMANLADNGVDTRSVYRQEDPSGHAIIQVDDNGENAIVLYGGANQNLTQAELIQAFDQSPNAQYVLLQNECNLLAESISLAIERGLKVALNPAPMTAAIRELPLEALSILVVNEGEAQALAQTADIETAIDVLASRFGQTTVVITLGAEGVLLLEDGGQRRISAPRVDVVDTTGAGDTFVGYFLASRVAGLSGEAAAQRACQASAIAVTRMGASPSIPMASELV